MAAGEVTSSDYNNTTELEKARPNHTTILPNILAAIVFFLPCLLFFILKLYFILIVYNFIIIFLLVSGISNVKWKNEINKDFN